MEDLPGSYKIAVKIMAVVHSERIVEQREGLGRARLRECALYAHGSPKRYTLQCQGSAVCVSRSCDRRVFGSRGWWAAHVFLHLPP